MPRVVLQKAFTLLYTRFASLYDYAAWLASAGYWYRWVGACLPYVEGRDILEIGCGRGYLLREIAARGFQVLGADYSEEMCRAARARSGQPVVRADGRLLPFPDRSFDTVVTTFPAPYILEEQSQREFARILRPSGQWLWVDVPLLKPTGNTWLSWLVNRLTYGQVPAVPPVFARDATGALWDIDIERVTVAQTTIAVRRARLRQPAAPGSGNAPA